jgi:4-aminobutyrate aminotransferase-like enzyme
MGKAMGNGFPIAGVAMRHELAASFAQGPAYFNTFGGCNAACASGLAVLKAIAEEKLQENAVKVGHSIKGGLTRLQDAFPDTIGDVRGHGLFIGAEIVCDEDSKAPSPGKATWLKEDMKRQQVQPPGHACKVHPPRHSCKVRPPRHAIKVRPLGPAFENVSCWRNYHLF